MSQRLAAVEAARRVLADPDTPAERLRGVVEQLLAYVEGQPRSVRLAAQSDQEFLNLARAARMEVHAARGALQRLDAFERALSRMLWPDEPEGSDH